MHRKRPRLYKARALLTGVLLASGSLAVAAPAAQARPAAKPEAGEFQQVTLAKGDEGPGEPMSLAVLPDGEVLHTSGTLRLTHPGGTTPGAGRLDVCTHDEEGLQGVGIDPGFKDNRFLYLYYAPLLDTPPGDAPETGTAADTHLPGGLAYVPGQVDADCAPETGYRDLFNGRTLEGWQQAGPGGFAIHDGTLTRLR